MSNVYKNHIYFKLVLWYVLPDCEDPGISKALYNDTATTYQTVLNVSCEDGYIVDGYPYITCLANGSWSTPPTCLLGKLTFSESRKTTIRD